MKTNKLKYIAAIILLGFSTIVPAKDIYLSPSGNDAGDGSMNAPVKTLSMALTKAVSGDEIRVTGFININEEPQIDDNYATIPLDGSKEIEVNGLIYNTCNPNKGTNGIRFLKKNVSIIGDDRSTCGFDGNESSVILRIDGAGSIDLKNLTLKGGNGGPRRDHGSGVFIRGSQVNAWNCDFIGNKNKDIRSNSNMGGAVMLITGTADFKNCRFTDNSNQYGSAISTVGGDLVINNCIFDDQDAGAINSSVGAAVYVSPGNSAKTLNLSVTGSVFTGNKVTSSGGAVFINETTDNCAIKGRFEACAFIDNSAGNNGGAVNVDLQKTGTSLDLNFINTTFYGNLSDNGSGSAGYISTENKGKSSVDFINCTATENKSKQGGAFVFAANTTDVNKGIYNCLFENNKIIDGTSDVICLSSDNPEIRNSVIGTGNLEPASYQDCYINYYMDEASSKAGFMKPVEEYVVGQNCIPLSENSEAATFGNAQYLTNLDIITDQRGRVRTFSDGKCAVGAVDPFVYPEDYVRKFQHFIIYGQSLSCGEQSYPPLSVENVEGNYMIGRQIWYNYGHKIADMTKFTPLVANIPESKMNETFNYRSMGDCPLVGAVNHIQLKTKGTAYEAEIVATSCGTGAKAIEQLSKNSGSLYKDHFQGTLNTAFNIAERSKIELNCPAIVWMQGEANSVSNDNGFTNSKDEYKALMVKLKNDMQSDIMAKYDQTEKPVFITYQTSGPFLKEIYEIPVAMAQLEAADEYDDIVCAGPVYPGTLPTSGAHLNSNGYRWYGEMIGKVYYKTRILKEDFKPLQPVGYYGTGNTDEVKIQFHVPHLPLVLDEHLIAKKTGYGFEVKLNNAKVTVKNVTIENDCVILKLSKNIDNADVIEISYAGVDIQAGNLRDSDPYASFYTYEDLDKKDEAGQFVYPRLDDKTLRPRLEPKDETGNVIYDKPYPLYNFCVAFYKKLNAAELGTTGVIAGKKNTVAMYLRDSDLYIETGNAVVEKVLIYNLSGMKVKEYASPGSKYSVASLPGGLYLAAVLMDNGDFFTEKIIK